MLLFFPVVALALFLEKQLTLLKNSEVIILSWMEGTGGHNYWVKIRERNTACF